MELARAQIVSFFLSLLCLVGFFFCLPPRDKRALKDFTPLCCTLATSPPVWECKPPAVLPPTLATSQPTDQPTNLSSFA